MPRLFGGVTKPQPAFSQLEHRIAKLGTHALHDWLDVAIAGLGRASSDARRHADSSALLEIEEGAEVVRLVAAELLRRA